MFTVLLSVFHQENPQFLHESLLSIYDQQTLKPHQIVVVQDGPLTPELDAVLAKWKEKLGDVLTLVPLHKNVGLGASLNEGLKHCTSELVARMDTDDISLPNRFAQQVQFMKDNPTIAASSAVLEEWNQDLTHCISTRHLPTKSFEIAKFAHQRSPLSHPLAIFRKSMVQSVGGYHPLRKAQDYALWGLLLSKGYQLANLPDVLLKMRAGDSLTARRNKEFLKREIELFQYLYNIGFLNKYELFRNILQRSIVRLSPGWVKKILYKYAR